MDAPLARTPSNTAPARRRWTGKRLFIGGEVDLRRTLIARALAVLGLYLVVVLLFWFDRDGLIDRHDGDLSLTDVVYFAAITVTTVGYGDIVPVTAAARTFDALLVTPIRWFIWFIFLGTAYQMVVQRFIEDLRMRALHGKLRDHVIICGFGHSGRCAAAELVARGMDPKQILVIDPNKVHIEEAAEAGYIGLLGNATREELLREALLETARAIFVCTDRDDTNVLIVLTARHLSSTVRIVARVEEAENDKLLKQSGANATVLPSRVGGILMAGSLDSSGLLHYAMDLMTAGGSVMLEERGPKPEEIGKLTTELKNALVMRLTRDGSEVNLEDGGVRVMPNDRLVVIKRGETHSA